MGQTQLPLRSCQCRDGCGKRRKVGPVETSREIFQALKSPQDAAEPSTALICKTDKKKYFLLSYIKPCGCKWIWKIGLFPLDIQEGGNKTISCNCYNDCSVTGGFLNAVFIQVHLKEHMELRDWCCGDTNYTGATYKSEWCCPEIMKFWLKTRSRLGKKLHFDKFLLLGRLKSFFLRLKSYIHKLVLQPLHIQLLHTLKLIFITIFSARGSKEPNHRNTAWELKRPANWFMVQSALPMALLGKSV